MASNVSRPDTLKKLDKRLRALSKQQPEWKDVHDLLFGLKSAEPKHTRAALDRTAATSAAALIEDALRRAITSHLRRGVSHEELKQLFEEPSAPLGSLGAKILMAQCLEIIRFEEKRDLDTIRIIRNAFAHSTLHLQFDNDPVKALCLKLRISDAFSDKENSARNIYISAVATYFFNLIDYSDQREFEPEIPGAT
jgi:hypothetical protein